METDIDKMYNELADAISEVKPVAEKIGVTMDEFLDIFILLLDINKKA